MVSDIGRSLHFYTDIIGMEQVNRPDFDRHGAWLTFGNLDLHLIKGIPSVHPEEEIHVGHITVAVETNKMANVRERLHKLGIKPREDVSLANGARSGSKLDQVYLRDPDGYYIRFCTCDQMEDAMNALDLADKTPCINVVNDEEEEDVRGISKFWKGVRKASGF